MDTSTAPRPIQEATPSLSKLADAILREYKIESLYSAWQSNAAAADTARQLTLEKRRDLLRSIMRAQTAAGHARCFNTSKQLEQMATELSA
mgnify:CR=1 FL=1